MQCYDFNRIQTQYSIKREKYCLVNEFLNFTRSLQQDVSFIQN